MPTPALSAMNALDATPCFRPALPHERLAARLLLPELTIAGLPHRPYVATAGAAGPIIGAGAAVDLPQFRLNGRCPAEVQAARTCKGRGIEAGLWARLLDDARRDGCGLVCHAWITNDADAPPATLGFDALERKYEFLATIEGTIAALGPLMDRLRRRGRVPDGARLVSFREADPAAVAALYVRYFPGTAQRFVASLRDDAPEAYDLDMSSVTLLGDVVTGFILGRTLPDESIFDVYWKAVDEHHRNGWSNAWCMYASAVRLRDIGIQRTRFRALTQNRDTQHLITHLGGYLSKVETRYGTDADGIATPSGA